jgi:hypothetical protein
VSNVENYDLIFVHDIENDIREFYERKSAHAVRLGHLRHVRKFDQVAKQNLYAARKFTCGRSASLCCIGENFVEFALRGFSVPHSHPR